MEPIGVNEVSKKYLIKPEANTYQNQNKHDASIWAVAGYVRDYRQDDQYDIKRMKESMP